MTITLKDIEAKLKAARAPKPGNGDHALTPGMEARPATREAAVLILLIPQADGSLNVLFTERTTTLKAHAGQVSFPGGGVEAQDKTRADTALREAQEEIGLDPANARVLGTLDDYVTRTGFCVTPVVAVLENAQGWQPQESEVARIFEVPLGHILDEKGLTREGVTFEGGERFFYAVYFDGARIWGATAGMLNAFKEVLQDNGPVPPAAAPKNIPPKNGG